MTKVVPLKKPANTTGSRFSEGDIVYVSITPYSGLLSAGFHLPHPYGIYKGVLTAKSKITDRVTLYVLDWHHVGFCEPELHRSERAARLELMRIFRQETLGSIKYADIPLIDADQMQKLWDAYVEKHREPLQTCVVK